MSMQEKLPRLYGAIVLIFPSNYLSSAVVELLPKHIERFEYSDCVEVIYKALDNVYSLEIDDLLTQLFSNCDLDLLYSFISNYNAQVLIDISFHHYTKYPALVFAGHNMQIIHKLQADISIDPY